MDIIHPELLRLITSSGAKSGNTQGLMGIVHEILVKPASDDTIYDVSLTDEMGIVVYERTSETGTLAEISSLPVNGVYTVELSNTTADELFLIKILVR